MPTRSNLYPLSTATVNWANVPSATEWRESMDSDLIGSPELNVRATQIEDNRMMIQNYKYWLNAMREAAIQLQQHELMMNRIQINREELAKAKKTKTGGWRFRIRCGSKYWHQIARMMLNELAERETVKFVDLQATIELPEHGRTFTKRRGENNLWANG